MFNVVNTLAPSFLIGSSSFLQVMRTTIISLPYAGICPGLKVTTLCWYIARAQSHNPGLVYYQGSNSQPCAGILPGLKLTTLCWYIVKAHTHNHVLVYCQGSHSQPCAGIFSRLTLITLCWYIVKAHIHSSVLVYCPGLKLTTMC